MNTRLKVKYSYYAILILDTVQLIVNSSQCMESYRKSWKFMEGTTSVTMPSPWFVSEANS